jgi:hypothetical protein
MRAVVSPVSALLSARHGTGGRTGCRGGCQLYLALGAGLCTPAEQTLPPASQADKQSYRIDETYIKVQREEKYLYRALDSTVQTIDFLLTAKRFLRRAFEASGSGMPRVMNVDKNPAYAAQFLPYLAQLLAVSFGLWNRERRRHRRPLPHWRCGGGSARDFPVWLGSCLGMPSHDILYPRLLGFFVNFVSIAECAFRFMSQIVLH